MDKRDRREYHKKYRQENKEDIDAKAKKYYQENKEAIRANSKKHYLENKEAIAANTKKYRQENKEAVAAKQKKYRLENKEAHAARSRKRREKNLGAQLWSEARTRANKKGREFTLTEQKMIDAVEHGYCEVTGLPFSKETHTGRDYFKYPFRPSIDRIDSELGYTDDNCHIVVLCYNQAKSNWHRQDVIRMSRALIKHQQERNQS